MSLHVDDAAAHRLLELHEQGPIDDGTRAIVAALRRLAMLLCGLVFASLVPDLGILPAEAPTLTAFHAERRAGRLSLQDARGRAAFALALLRAGIDGWR